MQIVVREVVRLAAPPEAVHRFVSSEDGFLSFRGFGPIPGIREVRFESGDTRRVGSIARVTNEDGSRHRERVVECEAPHRYAIRLDEFSSVFGRLIAYADERWVLSADGAGTHAERSFTFALRSPLFWPLTIPLAQGFFRLALRKHHAWLAREEWAGEAALGTP